MNWFIKGVRKGVKTERAPTDVAAWSTELGFRGDGGGSPNCPTSAIEGGVWVAERCVYCRRCYPQFQPTGNHRLGKIKRVEKVFARSFYLYAIDVGTCGACNAEFKLIGSPQCDMTRFGIFFTNTPRHADALVVMGVMTEGMREAFKKAYEAMPEPKLVIALGACATSGGLFGEEKIDADVVIPGCPPSPYTILDALIRAKGGEGW
ncbi:MAG: NADH:ubiquinone oxidoreductase [Thermoprotei archaeon]